MSSQQSAVIISGFVCIGQAELANAKTHNGYSVINLDSTPFQTDPTTRAKRSTADFVKAYMAKIAGYAKQKVILIVSTHAEVRQAMCNQGLKYTLVYPGLACKDEWLRRLETRAGKKDQLYTHFATEWKKYIDSLTNGNPDEFKKGAKKVVLGNNGTLATVIDGIIKTA